MNVRAQHLIGRVCTTLVASGLGLALVGPGSACNPATGGEDAGTASDGASGADSGGGAAAPDNLLGKQITLSETGGPENTWLFPDGTGDATLVGVGDFPFTFTKTGTSTSTLTFDVGGEDEYEMTWETESSGSFQESFDGVRGNPGTFAVQDRQVADAGSQDI